MKDLRHVILSPLRYQFFLESFQAFFGPIHPEKFPAFLPGYIDLLYPLIVSTPESALAHYRRILEWIRRLPEQKGKYASVETMKPLWFKEDIMGPIQHPGISPSIRILTQYELEFLLRAMPRAEVKTILMLSTETGMSIHGIIELFRDESCWNKHSFFVRREKRNIVGYPLSEGLSHQLNLHPGNGMKTCSKKKSVSVSSPQFTDNRVKLFSVSHRTVRKSIRSASEHMGFGTIQIRTIDDTIAFRSIENGVSLEELSLRMGLDLPIITRRYGKFREHYMRQLTNFYKVELLHT